MNKRRGPSTGMYIAVVLVLAAGQLPGAVATRRARRRAARGQ